MIKAVIFDFGRVISAQKPASLFQDYEAELGLPPGKLNQTMFASESWKETLIGRKTNDEHWQDIGPTLGLNTPEEIEAFRVRYFGDEEINTAVVEQIRSLRGQYKLAVLSNAPSGLVRWLGDWQIGDLFDLIVCSGDVGVAKPDPAIFELTLDRLGVSAEEAVFIDDSRGHVAAANAVGLHGILFTDAEDLRAELDVILK